MDGELKEIIDRNERRKEIKRQTTPGLWHTRRTTSDFMIEAIRPGTTILDDDGVRIGEIDALGEADARFICTAHSDIAEDDIDTLLARIADLERALAELS